MSKEELEKCRRLKCLFQEVFIFAVYMIYAIMCVIGRDSKYDGHPDTW